MTALKDFIPPYLLRKISGLLYGWQGNYSTWEEAVKSSTGYDSSLIHDKVKDALLQVKSGKAVFERDSVLFDKKQYSFPLLSALSLAAMNNQRQLHVLDFGGSLGSSYFQNREFYLNLESFHWCIVEQKHFVESGIQHFQDEHLHFYYDVETCTKAHKINVLLLSSVLQYIEKPYELLDKLMNEEVEYLMIDRAPLLSKGGDRITIQKVPSAIYKAKYPSWLLNEDKLVEHISKKYDLIFNQKTDENINTDNAYFRALLFKIKK